MARSLDDVLSTVSDVNRWKLDQEIDFENMDDRGLVIHLHLDRIADSMVEWGGVSADHLGLSSESDWRDIRERYPNKPSVQRREALSMWKSRLGRSATYRLLIDTFLRAGRVHLAEFVCELLGEIGSKSAHEVIRVVPPPHKIPRMSAPSMVPVDQLVSGLQENEWADKFQKALMNAKVDSAVLQFDEPFLWRPQHKSIYIRSAYQDILDILDNDQQDYMIIGNPGTGKTCFAVYVLYHALRASKTVVFHRSSESTVYLFKPGQKAQKGWENKCRIPDLSLRETLYLYDAGTRKYTGISPERSRLIVFSSPSKRNIDELRKQGLVSIHMPIWSIDELLLASKLDHCQGRMTETLIKDLFEKFGGIARYVLEVVPARRNEYICMLESNILNCTLRTIRSVGREDIGTESHMIFHRQSGPESGYYEYEIKFASQYVGDKIVDIISKHGYEEMKAFVRMGDISPVAASLRGWILEAIVHNELPNGGTFHVRQLFDNKEEQRDFPKMKLMVFDKLEEANLPHLSSSEYLQPKSKTFEAADAISPPNNIFQVTVSTSHPIKASGLKKILKELQKCKDWTKDTRVNYYFVVPPDVYKSFDRAQNYHTAKHTVSKRDKFENVDQYVLKFTF